MLEKITQILKDYKGVDELTLTESTTFTDLELDSLDTVDLVMSMEEEFGVSLELDDPIKNIGDLIKLIESSK